MGASNAYDQIKFLTNVNPTTDDIREFISAYKELELRKNLKAPSLDFYEYYRNLGELVITKTTTEHNDPLSYHIYIKRDSHAILLNSITIREAVSSTTEGKNFAGRANRLNHWEDIKFFKKLGIACLDLGGWSRHEKNEQNENLLSIAKFKLGFGAKIIYAYYQLIPVTLLGKMIIKFHRISP